MLRIRKIVAPTDHSDASRRAFDHARYIAERYEAELHVLHIDRQTPDGVIESTHAPVGGESQSDFREGIVHVQRRGFSVAASIIAYAEEIDADLIVLATRGLDGRRRIMLGSTAEDVMMRARCPVLTVRTGGASVPGTGVRHVLVAVDFSDVSASLVRHAQELAAAYEAHLDVLHVIEVPKAPAFYKMDGFQATVPALASASRQALIALADGGPSVPTRYHVMVGHAAHDILDFAEAQTSDLILLGVTRSYDERFELLGGVAEQVIRRAPCLVATIRLGGKSLVEPSVGAVVLEPVLESDADYSCTADLESRLLSFIDA